jgi:hypothetical protein
MASLTLELPDSLMQQLEQRGLSIHRLQTLVGQWMQSYLQKNEEETPKKRESEWEHQVLPNGIEIWIEPLEGKPYRYPTVLVSASSLDMWRNLALSGYEGDALADTEALYDEV